tara:strand:+ start:1019 stop:1222 length:204 start_codon:yes stop_codon:yes gene_type:complete
MSNVELKTMIILIEGEYCPEERNMPGKMVALLHKEFGVKLSEQDILNFYGIGFEDYEREGRKYESRH